MDNTCVYDERVDSNGNILCEFCDDIAIYKNCYFWPATQEDSVSGPFCLCINCFNEQDELYGSTNEEILIKEE